MQKQTDPFGWVGATIDGKYRIDEVVGEGGFGVVYRGYHLGFSEVVAIKCLKFSGSMSAPEREAFHATFIEEGRILHRLSRASAGIVQALDVGAAVSPTGVWVPYLALEWLRGVPLNRDLSDRRARGETGRPLSEAIALLAPAAKALDIAHIQGVAHRDVKPANLFLAQVADICTIKVLDFGIAKVMSDLTSTTQALAETGNSLRAFTPQYGAPEQFHQGFGATGPWTDVFALALVLIEVASGHFALEGSDVRQLYIAVTDEARRPSFSGVGVSAPAAVEAALQRALAVDPRERYRTAGKFWDAVEAALGEARTVFVYPLANPSSPPKSAVASAPAPANPAEVEAPKKDGGNKRPLVPPIEHIDANYAMAALVVIGPEHLLQLGAQYELRRGTTRVGRGLDSDIVINDPYLADTQALIEFRSGSWVLCNSARANYTYRNDKLVDAPVCLEYGDRVQFGRTRFKFVDGNKYWMFIDERVKMYDEHELKLMLKKEILGAREAGKKLSVLMFGIEDFRNLEVAHGRERAELALEDLARLVQAYMPAGGYLARYRDALVLVIPGIGRTRAGAIVDVHGDRVRKQLSELSPSNQVQVKIQIAAATLEKKDVSALHLLERTSRALAIAARPQDGARAAGVRQVGEAVRSAAPRQDPARLGNNRILWVEDHREFEFGARVRQDLKSLGLQFVFALSTSEALEKLARQKFVAVVSDMVREDGMREGCVLLEAMRRRGDETPFFIYAGLNFPGRERSMKELGGQGCTDDAQELFEMIARVLANR